MSGKSDVEKEKRIVRKGGGGGIDERGEKEMKQILIE
jgi:hypothetical protein